MTLLLTGGHQYTLSLSSDAPLLQDLLTTIAERTHSHSSSLGSPHLFQIPIDEGTAALCFPSEHLVGLMTKPPLFISQPEEPVEAEPPELRPTPEIQTSRYVQIDNFLSAEEASHLLSYALSQEAAFVPTSTSTGATDYRRSLILYALPDSADLISERLQAALPDVLGKLEIPPFPVAQIEVQLTAHNDGNYYKIHNDNGSPDVANRELTYVYYFYREPKPFSGGELRLYDSQIEHGFYTAAESYTTLEPGHNRLVVFLSRYLHEVLPVTCASQAFADSRFTLNGWVRRATEPLLPQLPDQLSDSGAPGLENLPSDHLTQPGGIAS